MCLTMSLHNLGISLYKNHIDFRNHVDIASLAFSSYFWTFDQELQAFDNLSLPFPQEKEENCATNLKLISALFMTILSLQ